MLNVPLPVIIIHKKSFGSRYDMAAEYVACEKRILSMSHEDFVLEWHGGSTNWCKPNRIKKPILTSIRSVNGDLPISFCQIQCQINFFDFLNSTMHWPRLTCQTWTPGCSNVKFLIYSQVLPCWVLQNKFILSVEENNGMATNHYGHFIWAVL